MVIACADAHRVPAGQALAVERFGFAAARITRKLALHRNIRTSDAASTKPFDGR